MSCGWVYRDPQDTTGHAEKLLCCEPPDGPRVGQGVKAREGTYHDAIHVKKSRVSLMLVEATGAISPRSLTVVGYHSRRARGARGRDSTKYGKSRASTTNYYIHHVQRISMAAAIGEAAGIHKQGDR